MYYLLGLKFKLMSTNCLVAIAFKMEITGTLLQQFFLSSHTLLWFIECFGFYFAPCL